MISPVSSVVRLDVRLQVVAGKVLDVLVRAEDGAAQPRAHECGAVQLVQNQLLVLLVHLHTLNKLFIY